MRKKPDFRNMIAASISENGHYIMAVYPDEDRPSFAYTIGLTYRGHPELIIFGFSTGDMHHFLTLAIRKVGEIKDRVPLEGILTIPVGVRVLPPEPTNSDYLIQAQAYYGRPVDAIQIVIPDVNGTLPWEPGCEARTAEYQSAVIDYVAEGRLALN